MGNGPNIFGWFRQPGFASRLQRGSIGRDAIILGSATSFGQVLAVILLPVITRLVSPVEYGFYAMFLAVTALLSIAASGRYEMAIVLPRSEQRALQLLVLSLSICTVYSILFAAISWSVADFIPAPFRNHLMLLVAMVFLMGSRKTFLEWLIRKRLIAISGSVELISTIVTLGAQIILCTLYPASWQLLAMASITGYGLSILVGLALVRLDPSRILPGFRFLLNWKLSMGLIRQYARFPSYTVPAGLVNSIGAQGTILILPLFFAPSVIGQLALATRAIRAPASMVSNALGRVITQRLAHNVANNISNVDIIVRYSRNIFVAGWILSLPIILFGDDIFAFVFGENWRSAGEYSVILIPMIIMNTCVGATSKMFVYGKNGVGLVWQIVYSISLALSLAIGGMLENIYISLTLYSISGSILYFVHLTLTLGYAGGRLSDFLRIGKTA